MESLASGTFVGAGSFRCQHCGYVLTLAGSDALTDCPGCGGRDFVRASLFSTERLPPAGEDAEGTRFPGRPRSTGRARLADPGAGEEIEQPGRVPLLRGGRRAADRGAHARVDAHRAQPGRRRALRRSDGLAPARADRAPARRRARARRPQPQRRVRQRRRGSRARCSATATRSSSGATA